MKVNLRRQKQKHLYEVMLKSPLRIYRVLQSTDLIRRKHFQKYLESYARALTARDAEKYTDGEDEVIDFETIINEVALLRNKWLGVMKGLESKNFMLGHVVRLRTAGMEDVTL
jgi:hypothetical protein